MKPFFSFTPVCIATYVLLTVTSGHLLAQTPPPAATPNATTNQMTRSEGGVMLNFENVEIAEVARSMGVMTGKSIVVDPRVKGTMRLVTDRPTSSAGAYNQFVSTARLQGFAMVEVSGITKLVPEADAKLQGGAVTTSEAKVSGNQIVTQIFRLNFETANNLVPILRPLISPNNTINVNPGNNSLVITDYADNLQRLARIVAALDVSNATDLEIIPLKYALANDMVPLLLRLAESGGGASAGQGQSDTSFKTTIVAEPRSNSIILRAANSTKIALIKSLIGKLDREPPKGNGDAGNIYVVHLKNADAVKVAATLRAAISGSPAAVAASAPAAGGAAAAAQSSAAPSTGGQIQADPATNSLIISAPEPQYRQIRAVIEKLDARRAQVFVESLIAEVNSDRAAEFGIQWQGLLGKKGDSNIGVLGSNFGSGGNNIISLAAGAGTVAPGKGFNFGLLNQNNGIYTLGFLARFLESTGDGNVLSTPNLLTLDNEEAKIVVGQNVPFVTGQFTNTGSSSSGTVNPFQTIERKDVGLTLRVKPTISENGTVKLQIFQEVSSVQASSVNSANGPITNKRSIESNVLVDDGSVVVLGGLLQDEFSGNQEKVPGLGDVPLFGNLFKTEARSRKKTNLMVFLRPVVVRDANATDALSMDRYELMRSGQRDTQPKASSMVPINEAAVLPSLLTPIAPISGLGAAQTPASK